MYEWTVYTSTLYMKHEIECLSISLDAGFMWCVYDIIFAQNVWMEKEIGWRSSLFRFIWLVLFSSDRCTVFNIQVMMHKTYNSDRLILLKEEERLEILCWFPFLPFYLLPPNCISFQMLVWAHRRLSIGNDLLTSRRWEEELVTR